MQTENPTIVLSFLEKTGPVVWSRKRLVLILL
jgi:hypothetical protein